MKYFEDVQFEVDAEFFEAVGIPMGETVFNLDLSDVSRCETKVGT